MDMAVSSMSAGQFWNSLKSEANAISWNLRDVVRSNSGNGTCHSLLRALQSTERIVTMIDNRVENHRKIVAERRVTR